jgi:hypothetical protein
MSAMPLTPPLLRNCVDVADGSTLLYMAGDCTKITICDGMYAEQTICKWRTGLNLQNNVMFVLGAHYTRHAQNMMAWVCVLCDGMGCTLHRHATHECGSYLLLKVDFKLLRGPLSKVAMRRTTRVNASHILWR